MVHGQVACSAIGCSIVLISSSYIAVTVGIIEPRVLLSGMLGLTIIRLGGAPIGGPSGCGCGSVVLTAVGYLIPFHSCIVC